MQSARTELAERLHRLGHHDELIGDGRDQSVGPAVVEVRERDHRVESARLHRKMLQQSVVVVGRHEIHATYGCCFEADLRAAGSAGMGEFGQSFTACCLRWR